ncbi:hypothetical protein ABAC460_20885 [Asticcacaulis sp. AC460]|uniref:hypothetical protein n=1 Tax=Asticcacaulis sp. AC460 TaxID=1282360 RepID=UPI0003C3DD6B|nr:hypothetical protein [Asticcacaulis sp. AC460]ESQ87228.1 hypothetical protein ABAC460_20885 [Asticcacaulis sp. AC460]
MIQATQSSRKVQTWLWVCLVLFPLIFYWFLLGKGYSTRVRLIGAAWLVAFLTIWWVKGGQQVMDFFVPPALVCDASVPDDTCEAMGGVRR